MKTRFTAVRAAAAALVCVGACFASMQAGVEELIRTRKYDVRGLGVVVKDLDRDSVVVAVNAAAPMNPASVLKLVTAAAAMEMLGPTYYHSTRVYTDGEFLADSGIVRGNLYIKGAGEPGINAEKMWLFVQHLRHRGVKQVTGDLIIDNFFFDDIGIGPGFSEDESRSYQALISALPVNYNSVGAHHRPGAGAGSPVHVDMFPRIEGFRINNTATTVEGGRGRLDVSTSLTGGTTQINVKGTMGLEEQPGYTYRRMWQTWEAFGGAFRAQCEENGLVISGKTVRRRVPDTLVTKGAFYTFSAEPLSDYVRHMLKWSSNFVSEMILKTLGALRQGEPGSWPKGAAVILDWWERTGLPGKPHIINGSGMGSVGTRAARNRNRQSPPVGESAAEDSINASTPVDPAAGGRIENLISAEQTVALLAHVSRQKNYFPEFLMALPSSGVDGTLRPRFQRSRLRGLVRGKTGSLNSLRVSSLAGYMFIDGKTYAFAIYCNNTGPNQYDNWIMQEQILEVVAKVSGNW